MVNKYPKGKSRARRDGWPEKLGEQLYALLKNMGGDPERGKLADLRKDWKLAVGEELAGMASFVGVKDVTLFLEAEDALVMQELRMREPEILAGVAAYLKAERYVKLRISLAAGRAQDLAPPLQNQGNDPAR